MCSHSSSFIIEFLPFHHWGNYRNVSQVYNYFQNSGASAVALELQVQEGGKLIGTGACNIIYRLTYMLMGVNNSKRKGLYWVIRCL